MRLYQLQPIVKTLFACVEILIAHRRDRRGRRDWHCEGWIPFIGNMPMSV